MRITAKVDYALRGALELAAAEPMTPVKGATVATAQDIPLPFLENILRELRHAGIVRTIRGADGGYMLARPADTITLADVIRAVEGPLAAVQGIRPDELAYQGAAVQLSEVWIAVRANLRAVLEAITLADVAQARIPGPIRKLAENPDARTPH